MNSHFPIEHVPSAVPTKEVFISPQSPLLQTNTLLLDNRAYHQVLLLGAAFCLVFIAFSAAQSAQTSSSNADVRANALGVLYACFTLVNLVVAYFVSRIGLKSAICFASVTYAVYVASNIQFSIPLIYFASVLLGCGAAFLWCAQGAYVTRFSQIHEKCNQLPESSSLGAFTGSFFSVYQLNQALGNGLVAFLHFMDMNESSIYTILTCVCISGCLLFLFLKTPVMDNSFAVIVSPNRVSIFDTISLWKDYKMLMIMPMFLTSGLTYNFMYF